MTRRLVIAMTLVAAAVAIALAVPMAMLVANDQRAAFVSDLQVRTLAAASVLASQGQEGWPATVADVAAESGARVVVVDDGLGLVADSDASATDRSFDRPEIQLALDGSLTSDIRPSQTLGTDLRYVAAPVVQGEAVVAAVRLSLPEDVVDSAVRSTQGWLAVFVLAVMAAAALVAWLVARSVTAPLAGLADTARRLPDDLALRADESAGPAEIRDVAVALNGTAARLGALVHRAQRVAADASHHLRTPLAGVRMRLEAIEDTAGERSIVEQAEAATAEVDRLTRRIDQVLALARADADSVPDETEDAAAIARDRVDAARAQAAELGIALEAEAPHGVAVLVPVGTVARAVDELLGNALQHARTRIRVEVSDIGVAGVLRVDDDGPGIPAGEREAVFERFARGSAAVPGGTGLGLALVREGAEVAGGSAAALASPLGGARIEVRWPLAR